MPVYRTPDGRIVEEKTVVKPPGGTPEAGRRRGGTGYADPTVVRRPTETGRRAPQDDERTRLAGAVPADTSGSEEIDPVTGWLVIVAGPGVGRDLRIGVGRNDLGRDRDNRIPLPFGDAKISRRAHLWVNYDPLNGAFSVAPGNSTNLAYLDGTAIEGRMPLADRSTISLGGTKLSFVAFCSDRFGWTDAD